MSNYNVAKAGVVALSESLLIELAQQEVGVHVVCPSFFQTNLLDSFRGPTPAMKAQVGKLLESSPITPLTLPTTSTPRLPPASS